MFIALGFEYMCIGLIGGKLIAIPLIAKCNRVHILIYPPPNPEKPFAPDVAYLLNIHI